MNLSLVGVPRRVWLCQKTEGSLLEEVIDVLWRSQGLGVKGKQLRKAENSLNTGWPNCSLKAPAPIFTFLPRRQPESAAGDRPPKNKHPLDYITTRSLHHFIRSFITSRRHKSSSKRIDHVFAITVYQSYDPADLQLSSYPRKSQEDGSIKRAQEVQATQSNHHPYRNPHARRKSGRSFLASRMSRPARRRTR